MPYTMPNGDRLDSIAECWCGDHVMAKNERVNTDPTRSWQEKGGIVAESAFQKNPMRFICDKRADNDKKVLFIYQATNSRNNCIVTAKDLTKEDRTLVSLIPNPAHPGKEWLITDILFHSIGQTWDGSHGCFSADYFRAFIANFELGDKGLFILNREPTWTAPDGYLVPGGVI